MKVKYSQIVRRKIKALKKRLAAEFGREASDKAINHITSVVRNLEIFPEQGPSLSSLYDIECDYRYLSISHNYLFYRIEGDTVIIIEMFDERENFMYQLFGISSISQESEDFWGE